jgi:NAD-dependent deacetylase
VVWFGEMLPEDAVARAWRLAEQCDVLLLVGTSGTVWPAAELPHVAKRSGARVIEVNPDPSELTALADVFLQGRAGDVLPRLASAVAEMKRVDA